MNISCDNNYTDTQYQILIGVVTSVSALAIIACLAAIVLIVVTRIYKVFLIRLVLYFILILTAKAAANLPPYYWPYQENISGYFILTTQWMQVLATVWITMYLFLLVMFKLQLNKAYQETVGVGCVVLIPLLFTWATLELPDWSCTTPEKARNRFLAFKLPMLLLMLGCFSAVSLMAGVLCKRWRANHYRYELQRQHWSVLREALPFIVYPAISCAALIIDGLIHIHYILVLKGVVKGQFAIGVYHSMPLEELVLPLVLILNPNTYRLLRKVGTLKRKGTDRKSNEITELISSQKTEIDT